MRRPPLRGQGEVRARIHSTVWYAALPSLRRRQVRRQLSDSPAVGEGWPAVEGGGLEREVARENGQFRRPAELTTLTCDVPTPQRVLPARASSLRGARSSNDGVGNCRDARGSIRWAGYDVRPHACASIFQTPSRFANG